MWQSDFFVGERSSGQGYFSQDQAITLDIRKRS